MRLLKKLLPILILALLPLTIASAQFPTPPPPFDDPNLNMPPDATSVGVAETVSPDITVQVDWVFVTDMRVEVGWQILMSQPRPDVALSEMHLFLGNGIQLPIFDEITYEIAPYISPERHRYASVFSHINYAGNSSADFTAIVLLKTQKEAQNPNLIDVVPVTFQFSAPVTQTLRWQGEQTVAVNGYPLTLKTVHYDPRMTILELCLPIIQSVSGTGDFYRPYITDESFSPKLLDDLRLYRVDSDEVEHSIPPEATAEPRIYNPMEGISDANTACVSIRLRGVLASVEGAMRLTIDELRTQGGPNKQNIHLISASVEAYGLPLQVGWDDANGFGFGGDINPQSHAEHRILFRQLWRIISDVTSERILGPWVFEVTVE